MKVIGIVGWKNNGKTTLVCKLIEHFRTAGLRVATVKHAHHNVDVDQPGKDSYRHREAGAAEVILATSKRWVHMHELAEGEPEPPLEALLDRLTHNDLVIVEGFKRFDHPKIEVHRKCRGTKLLALDDPTIICIASDEPLEIACPVIDLDDVDAIAVALLAGAHEHGGRQIPPDGASP